jgi:TolB-like protein
MKRLLYLLLMSILFFALASCVSVFPAKDRVSENPGNAASLMAKEIIKNAEKATIDSLAVIPFSETGSQNTNAFSQYFADELISALFKQKNDSMRIIERSQLEKLLKEANFSLSGAVSSDTAAEIGKIVGVDALVIGTMTAQGDVVRLNARLVSVETAELLSVADASLRKTDEIAGLMGEVVGTGSGNAAKDSGKGSGGKDETIKEAKAAPIETQEVDDFSIELTRCRVSGNNVVFEFTVTNKGSKKRKISFNRHTMALYDGEGNVADKSSVTFGSEEGGPGGAAFVGQDMVPEVPVKARLEMIDAAAKGLEIKAIEIGLVTDSFDDTILFRNVPLSK